MEFFKWIISVSAIASLLFLGLVFLSGWGLSGAYVPSLTDGFPATLYLEKYSSGGICCVAYIIIHHPV